jgi:hypothetical protein
MAEVKDQDGDPVPPCAPQLCQSMQPRINKLCHANGWPPDHPIIIMQPDGKVCLCFCL